MTSTVPSACLLTTGELALLLDVTRQSVTKWCREGRLPFHPFPGRNQDRRIEIGDALAFARREKQYLDLLEAKAVRAGVIPLRCPRVLIVSPTVEYVLPLVRAILHPSLAEDAATAGSLLTERCYPGVILDAALPRSELRTLLRMARRQRSECAAGILVAEDDADPLRWYDDDADLLWGKPCNWKQVAADICRRIAHPGAPVPPVPALAIAA